MTFMRIAALAAPLALVAGGLFAADRTLTFNAYQSPKSAPYKAFIAPFAEGVEEATEGRIAVSIPAASMAPPPGQYQLAETGVADLAIVVSDFELNRLSLPQITRIPGLSTSAAKATQALWQVYGEHFAAADEFKGVHVLALFVGTPTSLQFSGDAVLAPEDMDGLKVRSQPGSEGDIVRKLGGTPVEGPITEVFDMMSKKIVDANIGHEAAAVVWNYAPEVTNVTEFPGGLMSVSYSVVMNKRTWEALSPEDQAAVTKVAEDLLPGLGTAMDKEIGMFRGIMEKNGTVFSTAGDAMVAQVAAYAEEAKADWIAKANALGVDGQAAFDAYVEAAK